MSGEQAETQQASGWYVIAREGDLVVRIRAGMQLGEDSSGELSFDAADAQVEFDIDEHGRILVLARSGRALATGSGDRARQVELNRDGRAQILLSNNVLSIATDFVESPPFADPPPGQADAAGTGLDSIIVVPEPVAGPFATTLLPTAEPNGDVASDESGQQPVSTLRPRQPPPTFRRRQLLVPLAVAALGSIAALVLLFVGMQSRIDLPTGHDTAGPADSAETTRLAEATDAPQATDAAPDPVEPATRPVDPATAPVEPATTLVEPASLASKAARRPIASETPRGQRTVTAADPPDVARRPPLPDTVVIEPVLVPPMPRRQEADPPPVALAVAPAAEPTPAPAEAAEFAEVNVDVEQLGRAVQMITTDVSNERDLQAAADALSRGFLVEPPAASAFDLYRRVLTSNPESEAARAGVQLVRERLLGQARASLAADDPAAAVAALDDAALVGVDQPVLRRLRAEADYRQLLLDAKTGKPGILFPITELTALSQVPPDYPRHAPADAEASVEIEMTVTESGEVRDVQVQGDPPMYFLRAAKRAVGEWRFAPVLHDGQAVAVRTAVTVTFRRDRP